MSELSHLEETLLREHSGDEAEYRKAKESFLSGTPLAYVLGEWYFYGLTLKVDKSCLIPRPDTELTVEKVIEIAPENGKVADLCTGSGCIAIAVKKNRPDLVISGWDISAEAVLKAKENAEINGTDVTFEQKDVFSLTLGKGEYDIIVSNPPYIRTDVLPTLDTVKKEPVIALDGGSDGLVFYRHIIKSFKKSLKSDGKFVFEIGYDQKEDIIKIAKENRMDCTVTKDYGGNYRVAVLTQRKQ